MRRGCFRLARGVAIPPDPVLGPKGEQATVQQFGMMSKFRPTYSTFTFYNKPMRPLRAIIDKRNLPPVLYDKADQLLVMENALQCKRLENQLEVLRHQMQLGSLRMNDELINDLFLKNDDALRPHMHDLWFHELGLCRQQHVISHIPAYQLIPIVSLISHDFELGRIDSYQVEELYQALSNVVVAHPDSVKRELANSVIRCHALDGNVEKAFAVIHDMRANNVRRNHVTYAPLFRLARKRQDVGLDMELRRLVLDVEGGRLNKWIWIDAARISNIGLVFLRYNWLPIAYFLLSLAGAATIHLLLITGIL